MELHHLLNSSFNPEWTAKISDKEIIRSLLFKLRFIIKDIILTENLFEEINDVLLYENKTNSTNIEEISKYLYFEEISKDFSFAI